MDDQDLRKNMNAARGRGYGAPRGSSEAGVGGTTIDGTPPAAGVPKDAERANRAKTVIGRGRADGDDGELFDLPSEGEPMNLEATELLRPAGGQAFTTGDFSPLGRKPGGSFTGGDRDADASAALREVGGLRKTTVNSSIVTHESVDIPSEGGPDWLREL